MTETARRKVAVILRGPPAIGKSSVSRLLAEKMPRGTTRQIDLDQGWGHAQNWRFPAGEARYADLKAWRTYWSSSWVAANRVPACRARP
jgi:hypothetical protein